MADLVLGALGQEPSIRPSHAQIVATLTDLQAARAPETELLVPLALWLAPEAASALKTKPTLVLLRADDDPLLLADRLDEVEGIAIAFDKFTDGRGYSQAVLLRERLHYRGQLRAVGDVLRDQLFYLLRCGFDAFEPRSDRSSTDFILAYRDFSVVYQKSATSDPAFASRGARLATKVL